MGFANDIGTPSPHMPGMASAGLADHVTERRTNRLKVFFSAVHRNITPNGIGTTGASKNPPRRPRITKGTELSACFDEI